MSLRLFTLALLVGGFVGLSAVAQTPPTTPDAPKPPTPAIIPDKAIELFRKKEIEGCFAELTKAAQAHPMAPHPRVQLAMLFFDARDGQNARAMLELAAKEDSTHPDVYLTNASFAFGEGRLTDALLNLTVALRYAETPRWNAAQRERFSKDSRLGLVACYEARGSWAGPPDHAKDNWNAAKEHLKALIDGDKKNTNYMSKLGVVEFQLGNMEAALAAFTQAHKDDPNVDPPELRMGMLWFGKNDPGETEKWLKKAIAAHPKEAKCFRGYAEFLLNERELAKAEEQLKTAETLAPTARDTLYIRGLYHRYKAAFGEAEKVFEDLSRKYPADILIAMNLALSLAESTDTVKQQRAIDLAETVVRQATRNAEAYAVLAYCNFKHGQLNDAEKNLGPATQTGRVGLDTAYYLACLLSARGKEEEAYKVLKAAVKERGPFVYKNQAEKLFGELDKKLPKEKKEDKPADKKEEKK